MSLVQRLNNIRNVGLSEAQEEIIEKLYTLEKPRDFENLKLTEQEIQDLVNSVQHYISTTSTNGREADRLRTVISNLAPRSQRIKKKAARKARFI